MGIPVLLFAVGLVMLIKGGDWFVDGATGLAYLFHLPELLIGATVVSIGTTVPEVMVSSISALSGHGEIAYGNAIGSVICNTALLKGHSDLSLGNVVGANLFNLVLVSGAASVLGPYSVPASKLIGGMNTSLVLEIPLMIAVMAFLTVPALVRGKLSRAQGVILLAVYFGFCIIQFFL